MGKSIDILIEKASKDQHLSHDLPQLDSQNDNERDVLFSDHQMVLSFLWHLLKMCCWSAAKLTQKYSMHMTDHLYEKFLVDTVVFVLIGTRHKGAMESAQEALALMTQCAFEEQLSYETSKRIEIVEEQLYRVLDSLESSVNQPKISTTRRAAGLAMLITAICSNIPRRHSTINERVILRLIKIAQSKVEIKCDSGALDLPSAVSLHILHSMIQSSKMGSFVEGHLSNICVVCLESFASEVWSVRNAALQLFGAVVPKLLGQKRVKDDTAMFNSISASEFLNRNHSLTVMILNLLNLNSCSTQDCIDFSRLNENCDISLDERKIILSLDERKTILSLNELVSQNFYESLNICPSEGAAIKASSLLVPILSLLARLNSSNEIQQNGHIKFVLNNFISRIFPLLGNPVYTIRRLAAASLTALTNDSKREKVLLLALNHASIQVRNNFIHGILMFIHNTIEIDSKYFEKHIDTKNKVSNWLTELLVKSKCYANVSLGFEILSKFNSDRAYTFLDGIHTVSLQPGNSSILRTIIRTKLQKGTINFSDCFLSDSQDVWEESYFFIKKILKEHTEINKFPLLQKTLWTFLESQTVPVHCKENNKVGKVLELLIDLLMYESLEVEAALKSINLLQWILSSNSNLKKFDSVVLSYFVANKCTLRMHSHSDSFNKLTNDWAQSIQSLSNPKMCEDSRICASRALFISLEPVLKNCCKRVVVFSLVRASMNLLQDEDSVIRIKSSLIVVPNVSWDSEGINPFVALNILINRIINISITNIDFIYLLWELGFEDYMEFTTPVQNSSFNLFESPSDNAYSEPRIISELVCSQLQKLIERKSGVYEIESDVVSKLTAFIHGKLYLLQELFESLYCRTHSKDKRVLSGRENTLKIIIIKNGLQFLEHISVLFNIQINFNIEILKQGFKNKESDLLYKIY